MGKTFSLSRACGTAENRRLWLETYRTIVVPLAWYPRLFHATGDQRRNWKISGAGFGIHWPDVDEDLSTEGLLRGAPAAQPARIRT
jgi:hypothetical protein